MGESKRHKYKLRLGVISAIILVILLVYFVSQIFGNMRTSLSLVKTQYVTDESYLSLNGYVYRNEELIVSSENEIVDFLVRNVERIPVGKEYLTVYKTNISGDGERRNVQGELDMLSAVIDSISDGLYDNLRVQDIDNISASLNSSYYSFISALGKDNYSLAENNGEKMLEFLNKYQIVTGKLDSLEASAQTLKEEKQSLIDTYAVGDGIIQSSDRSCYVYRDVDGYEQVFSYADVMNMSVSEFREKIDGVEPIKNSHAVGKRVYDSKWYLVVPINYSNVQLFTSGLKYDIYLSEIGNKKISMNVERVEMSESGNAGFVVLSSNEIGTSFEVSRYTSIKILKSSVSGYRVPEAALYSLDIDSDGYSDYTGVYVMSGNYVKFRRINVISYGDGYVIAKDSDDADEEFPYLSGNELIIASGGNLYDGKLIK